MYPMGLVDENNFSSINLFAFIPNPRWLKVVYNTDRTKNFLFKLSEFGINILLWPLVSMFPCFRRSRLEPEFDNCHQTPFVKLMRLCGTAAFNLGKYCYTLFLRHFWLSFSLQSSPLSGK